MNVGKEILLVHSYSIHIFAQLLLLLSFGFFVDVDFFVDANTYGFAFLNVDMSLQCDAGYHIPLIKWTHEGMNEKQFLSKYIPR